MPTPSSYTQIKDLLAPVFATFGIRRAVLFGSYAAGSATERSDVDILVDSGLKGLGFVGLLESIQSVLGTTVDLLDITHITPGSLIDQEITRSGVLLYEK